MTKRKTRGGTPKLNGFKGLLTLLSAVSAFVWCCGGPDSAKARVTDTLGNVAGSLHARPSGSDADSGTGTPSDDPAMLTVAGPGSMRGYARSMFGQAWTDDVKVEGGHNGCDTRNDTLRRDLIDTDVVRGCKVMSGLLDPYTGQTIEFRRGPDSSAVQIDHVVPLGNAWVSGAQYWPLERRKAIANDPMNLLAVDGHTNMSKGDKNAAEWLPPIPSFRCVYVKSQVRVKNKYKLTVTAAEKQVMVSYYGRC